MNKPKRGCVCAAKNCKSKSYLSKKSFFRFPVDPVRAKKWVLACDRQDLLCKLNTLHEGYRVCGDHFEDKMFTNRFHNRLNPNAIPTLFTSLNETSIDHTYSSPSLTQLDEGLVTELNLDKSNRITVLEDIMLGPDSSSSLCINTEDTRSSTSPECPSPSSSNEKLNTLSFDTTRKIKYHEVIEALTIENKMLKQKIKELEKKLENIHENVTLEQYQALTYKFCNSLDLANFINLQILHSQNKKQDC